MSKLPHVEPTSPFSYTDSVVPPQYHCGQCGAHGVKLWREYNTFLNHQSLLCGDCSVKEQKTSDKTYTVADGAGPRFGKIDVTVIHNPDPHKLSGSCGDQIGWRIPAVPTEDGTTYWGYSSVSADGVAWWNRLTLRKT